MHHFSETKDDLVNYTSITTDNHTYNVTVIIVIIWYEGNYISNHN